MFTLNLSPHFAEKSERGIRGFELYGGVGNFSTWKVQGKLGGYTGYVATHVHGLASSVIIFALASQTKYVAF